MRYALIDNSTLTAVQRLLGEIEVKDKLAVEGDILSLENYLQAILFYDDIICIDDYKRQHREARRKFFPNIKFVSPNLFNYQDFVDESIRMTKDVVLRVDSGQVADKDFKEYFSRLKMNLCFTWDLSSSHFFLVQKMLTGEGGVEYEDFNKLHSMIFGQKNDDKYNSLFLEQERAPTLIGRDKTVYMQQRDASVLNNMPSGDGLTPRFSALVASLNWMSQRTAFYTLVADYLQADLFLQPIRQEFMLNVIKKVYPGTRLGLFNNVMNSMRAGGVSTLKEITAIAQDFEMSQDIPLFSAYFASATSDPLKFIEAAYEERDKPPFFEARVKLRELNNLLLGGERGRYVKEINQLLHEVTASFERIKSKYGVGGGQGLALSQLRFLWSFIPGVSSLTVPKELDRQIKSLEFMKHLLPQRGFKAVYRKVIDELVQVDRLGQYKDVILSRVAYHKEATTYGVKTEDSRYKNRDNGWKRPM